MKLVLKRRTKTEISIFFLFAIIIMPEMFTQIRMLAYVFAVLQLLVFFYYGYYEIKKRGLKKYYFVWCVISLYLLFLMIIYGNYRDIDKWGRLLILVLDTMMILDYYIEKGKTEELLSSITFLGIIYFAINSLMIVFTPNGFLRVNGLSYYLLGIRTDFLKFFFPFALVGGLNFIYYKKRIRTIILFALAIFNFIELDVSTSIVSILVLAILIIFRKGLSKFVNVRTAVLVAVVMNIAFIFLNALSSFSWFIVGVLRRDLTLTHRVYIWQEAVRQILDSKIGLIFGHGIVNGGSFVQFGLYGGSSFWPAHNQFLQWLFEYGILGTIAILAWLISLDNRNDDLIDSYYCRAIIMTMLVTSISSGPFVNHLGYICACFLPLIIKMRQQVETKKNV